MTSYIVCRSKLIWSESQPIQTIQFFLWNSRHIGCSKCFSNERHYYAGLRWNISVVEIPPFSTLHLKLEFHRGNRTHRAASGRDTLSLEHQVFRPDAARCVRFSRWNSRFRQICPTTFGDQGKKN